MSSQCISYVSADDSYVLIVHKRHINLQEPLGAGAGGATARLGRRGSSRSEYYVGGEEENRIYDLQRLLMKAHRVLQDRLKLT